MNICNDRGGVFSRQGELMLLKMSQGVVDNYQVKRYLELTNFARGRHGGWVLGCEG